MWKRPYFAATLLALLPAVLLFSLPPSAAGRVKLGISGLFVPLFGLAGAAESLATQAGQALVPRATLANQIRQLQQENQQLRALATQADEALRENARLRVLVGWQPQARWKLKAARVIARDTTTWWRTVQIDVGSRDGVRPNAPVLTPEGVIGRIQEVGSAHSLVVLIGDPLCRVGVVVRETGENGVITTAATGVFDHQLADLTHLPRNSLLRPGQSVYTSGLGGVFPAGLPVGTIVDSRSVGFGLYSEARVKLAADSSRLREVMVMVP